MRAADRPSFSAIHIFSNPLRSNDPTIDRWNGAEIASDLSPLRHPYIRHPPKRSKHPLVPRFVLSPPITITADRVETDRGSDASSPNNPPPPPPELFGRV